MLRTDPAHKCEPDTRGLQNSAALLQLLLVVLVSYALMSCCLSSAMRSYVPVVRARLYYLIGGTKQPKLARALHRVFSDIVRVQKKPASLNCRVARMVHSA
jgi:hypothetical protein